MTLKDLMSDIKYFTAEEVLRKCSKEPPEKLLPNIIPTLLVADHIRELCGFPLVIDSAYRDPEYNAKVHGSAPNSLHLQFNALDLRPAHWTIENIGKLISIARKPLWKIPYKDKYITGKVMGIGLYNLFVHIDTRGLLHRKAPARWDRRSSV